MRKSDLVREKCAERTHRWLGKMPRTNPPLAGKNAERTHRWLGKLPNEPTVGWELLNEPTDVVVGEAVPSASGQPWGVTNTWG